MPELRELMTALLSREGHEVVTVEDGSLAWEKIQAAPGSFDLLITDHHMPRMNGLELVARVRTAPFSGKVIVFSSDVSNAVREKYREYCVDQFLPKPIFREVLVRTLRELFEPSNSAPV